MRKKEEILDSELEKLKSDGFAQLFYRLNREKVLKIIENIQIEAYNQALEDAANCAHGYSLFDDDDPITYKSTILDLKK